jgi:hypothetical protein
MSRPGAIGALRVAAVGFLVAVVAFAAIVVRDVCVHERTGTPGRCRLPLQRRRLAGGAVMTFELMFLPPFLLGLFCLAIPVLFSRAEETGASALPRAGLLAASTLVGLVVGYLAFRDAFSAVALVPTLAVALPPAAAFIGRLNLRLAQRATAG